MVNALLHVTQVDLANTEIALNFKISIKSNV